MEKTTARAKYRGSSPFDYAQGQNDSIKTIANREK
jgi:hypothetical protein